MNNLKEDEILKRGITRLCHFTKSSKLLHILSNENGIIANSFLDEDILAKNDEYRYDGYETHISCSIEYPNTWYLDKVKNQDPLFKDWVIIFINPYILLKENVLFSHRNAAANKGKDLKPGIEGFKGMFSPTVQGKFTYTRTQAMLPCCPTDGQAEILIYENIPRSEIKAIAVNSEEQARIEKIKLEHIPEAPDINFIVAPSLFNNSWNALIKCGQRPKEYLYRGGQNE